MSKSNRSGWEVKKLGDIFSIHKGKKVEIVEKVNENTKRFIQIEDLRNDNNLKYCLINKNDITSNNNDIIIAWDGANAGISNYGLNGVIGSTLAVLRCKIDNCHTPYIGNFLKLKEKYLRSSCTGATIPHLNRKSLEDLEIPLPPLQEQIKIASILEKADKLRQKRKQVNKMYDEFLQAVFLDMFGDPVTNPKVFSKQYLRDLTTLVSSGSTPKGGEAVYQREGIIFIRSQNIRDNKVDYENIYFINNDIHNSMKRTWVKNNDVLLNITGASIGRTAIFYGDDNTANVNQHVAIIRLIQNKILPKFLLYHLTQKNYQYKIISANQGGTREAFNFEQIKQFEIIMPPIELQNKFASIVEKVESLKEKAKKSEQEIENLFNSLMQNAFNGNLDLSKSEVDIEKQLAEV